MTPEPVPAPLIFGYGTGPHGRLEYPLKPHLGKSRSERLQRIPSAIPILVLGMFSCCDQINIDAISREGTGIALGISFVSALKYIEENVFAPPVE